MDQYRPKLKICGVTNPDDARLISDSGADYCGLLVGVDFSERNLSLAEASMVASASRIPVVVLLCNPKPETVLEVVRQLEPVAIQLLSEESPQFVSRLKSMVSCQLWKTIHLQADTDRKKVEDYAEAGTDVFIVDNIDNSEGFTRLGGTGKLADWEAAIKLIDDCSLPVFLAGGINPQNVEQALIQVRPYGIDLCSGVEASKGRKDAGKVRSLVNNFRKALESISKPPI